MLGREGLLGDAASRGYYEVLRISRVLLSKRGEWWGEVFEDAELVSLKDLEEIIESMGGGAERPTSLDPSSEGRQTRGRAI